jgi:hypothetical protein
MEVESEVPGHRKNKKFSENKKFFFEKKNQKTFAPLRGGVKQEGSKFIKRSSYIK